MTWQLYQICQLHRSSATRCFMISYDLWRSDFHEGLGGDGFDFSGKEPRPKIDAYQLRHCMKHLRSQW